MYVLTQKLLRSVQSLREQGVCRVPCVVLADGRRQESFIGPGVTDRECYVLIGGIKRVVPIVTVAVDEAVKAQLERVAAERAEEEEAIERAAEQARMWRRSGARRNPTTGQYTGQHIEPAGRK